MKCPRTQSECYNPDCGKTTGICAVYYNFTPHIEPLPPNEGEEAIGDDALLNISRFAVENKYKSPMAGNETAIWMVDIPKVINYIKENYKLSKK